MKLAWGRPGVRGSRDDWNSSQEKERSLLSRQHAWWGEGDEPATTAAHGRALGGVVAVIVRRKRAGCGGEGVPLASGRDRDEHPPPNPRKLGRQDSRTSARRGWMEWVMRATASSGLDGLRSRSEGGWGAGGRVWREGPPRGQRRTSPAADPVSVQPQTM